MQVGATLQLKARIKPRQWTLAHRILPVLPGRWCWKGSGSTSRSRAPGPRSPWRCSSCAPTTRRWRPPSSCRKTHTRWTWCACPSKWWLLVWQASTAGQSYCKATHPVLCADVPAVWLWHPLHSTIAAMSSIQCARWVGSTSARLPAGAGAAGPGGAAGGGARPGAVGQRAAHAGVAAGAAAARPAGARPRCCAIAVAALVSTAPARLASGHRLTTQRSRVDACCAAADPAGGPAEGSCAEAGRCQVGCRGASLLPLSTVWASSGPAPIALLGSNPQCANHAP